VKILFLSKDYPPHLIGGVGVYVYELSRLLARQGHETFVITQTDDVPIEYFDQGVRVYRVKPRRIGFWDILRPRMSGLLERLEYSLAVSEKMEEVIQEHRIDIVETSEARAEGFWYYLSHRKPPLVIKLHTPETIAFVLDHTPVTMDYRLMKLLEEHWICKATRKIGLSKEVAELTSRHFSMKLGNLPFVPNPIDINLFRPSENHRDDSTQEILYVGRLEFRKGIHTLIRAFRHVQAVLPEVKLTLIGSDCGMSGYLFESIAKLRYPQKVNWIGHVSREALIEYYQRSTVCVVPSLWENYPYVCLEAMACGKTVVASRIGGLARMITDRYNGLLFSVGSSKGLAEVLIAALKDSSLRKQLGGNARRTIEETHSPKAIAEQTLHIYAQLLN
jgi:glycosyltransferase involved in cell wall biosynthesis